MNYFGWDLRQSDVSYAKGTDFVATSPDYDVDYQGAEDGWVASGTILHGESFEELMRMIDEHIAENEE